MISVVFVLKSFINAVNDKIKWRDLRYLTGSRLYGRENF